MLLLFTLFLFAQTETDRFELPETYTEWQDVSQFYTEWYVDYLLNPGGPGASSSSDSSFMPGFEVDTSLRCTGIWEFESPYGSASYMLNQKNIAEKGNLRIKWLPHIHTGHSNLIACYNLIYFLWGGYHSHLISWDSGGVKRININGLTAYRLRGYNMRLQCDHSNEWIRKITLYYIPTAKYDFYIWCSALVYEFHSGPEGNYEEYAADARALGKEEIMTEQQWDSMLVNWEKVTRYEDHIAELEHAVEQTFRVRE